MFADKFGAGLRAYKLAVFEQIKYPNLLVLTKGDERLVLLIRTLWSLEFKILYIKLIHIIKNIGNHNAPTEVLFVLR